MSNEKHKAIIAGYTDCLEIAGLVLDKKGIVNLRFHDPEITMDEELEAGGPELVPCRTTLLNNLPLVLPTEENLKGVLAKKEAAAFHPLCEDPLKSYSLVMKTYAFYGKLKLVELQQLTVARLAMILQNPKDYKLPKEQNQILKKVNGWTPQHTEIILSFLHEVTLDNKGKRPVTDVIAGRFDRGTKSPEEVEVKRRGEFSLTALDLLRKADPKAKTVAGISTKGLNAGLIQFAEYFTSLVTEYEEFPLDIIQVSNHELIPWFDVMVRTLIKSIRIFSKILFDYGFRDERFLANESVMKRVEAFLDQDNIAGLLRVIPNLEFNEGASKFAKDQTPAIQTNVKAAPVAQNVVTPNYATPASTPIRSSGGINYAALMQHQQMQQPQFQQMNQQPQQVYNPHVGLNIGAALNNQHSTTTATTGQMISIY